MGSVDDEDEIGNEAATVMSGQSFDDMLAARDGGSDAGALSGEPTQAGASADGFDDPDDKTVASPSFDEMERMRAEAAPQKNDIAFAQTAMGPSYDERLASQQKAEASSSPAAAGPVAAPGPPPPPPPPSPPRSKPAGGAAPPASDPFSPAGDRPPNPAHGPSAQPSAPHAASPHSPAPNASSHFDESGGVMPKTMVLGPNDWGGVPAGPPQGAPPAQGSPHAQASPSSQGAAAPDPFAPAPAGGHSAPYGSQPQSYGYAAPAPHVQTPPPAGGKKNNTLILFLAGLALVLVLGGLAGGALLLVLFARS